MTGVHTCALPIFGRSGGAWRAEPSEAAALTRGIERFDLIWVDLCVRTGLSLPRFYFSFGKGKAEFELQFKFTGFINSWSQSHKYVRVSRTLNLNYNSNSQALSIHGANPMNNLAFHNMLCPGKIYISIINIPALINTVFSIYVPASMNYIPFMYSKQYSSASVNSIST